MSHATQPRWRLTTSSYAEHRPEFGVPVSTSVGPHPDFTTAPVVHVLKPFGVFGVMTEQPVEIQRDAYHARLHKYARTIERQLDALTAEYPGQALCLLCWCRRDISLRGECHRRWCADWLTDVYSVHVPEASAYWERGLG